MRAAALQNIPPVPFGSLPSLQATCLPISAMLPSTARVPYTGVSVSLL